MSMWRLECLHKNPCKMVSVYFCDLCRVTQLRGGRRTSIFPALHTQRTLKTTSVNTLSLSKACLTHLRIFPGKCDPSGVRKQASPLWSRRDRGAGAGWAMDASEAGPRGPRVQLLTPRAQRHQLLPGAATQMY